MFPSLSTLLLSLLLLSGLPLKANCWQHPLNWENNNNNMLLSRPLLSSSCSLYSKGISSSSSFVVTPTCLARRITTRKRIIASPNNFFMSHAYYSATTRLYLGSKAGVDGNPIGKVDFYNEQNVLTNINEEKLIQTVQEISNIIGYPTYDVTLILVDDDEMRETNLETRNVDAPTDILSFPFHQHVTPGVLQDPQFDIPDFYTLGDMMIDVPYVIRRCKEDEQDNNQKNDNYDDDEEEEERGVSGAMATEYDPETRLHMLLVHGMLHLVGYDHEDDEDYEIMVTREEEILKQLGYLNSKKQ